MVHWLSESTVSCSDLGSEMNTWNKDDLNVTEISYGPPNQNVYSFGWNTFLPNRPHFMAFLGLPTHFHTPEVLKGLHIAFYSWLVGKATLTNTS